MFLYKIANSKTCSGGGFKERTSEFLVIFTVIQSKRLSITCIVLVRIQDLQQGYFSFANSNNEQIPCENQKKKCRTSFVFTIKHFLNSEKILSCTRTLKV